MTGVEIVVPERLAGEVVVLRPLRAADAPAYSGAFRDDQELGRLLGVAEDPSEADVAKRAEEAAERARIGRNVRLAICAAVDGEFLGEVGLHSFAWKHRRCELGVFLIPAVRGRGFARDAIACVLRWAFDDLAIERMEMATTPDNVPTRELARRIGFEEEGLQRKRFIEQGARVDMVVFGLLASEWSTERSPRA
jgi:[ribosomal protein S5]-alanine N-acetyltransferase